VQAGEVKPGAVVCDVGYPKNVAAEMEGRRDVLAFGGGYAGLPVPLHFGYDIGLPCDEVLYGCFSESIVLALEGRNENFSTGRGGITAEKMEEIGAAALRHGFDVAPFYAGKRRLTDEDVEQVKEARRRRLAEEGR
jgi:predicted amino acid dehydrogenase